MKKKPWLVYGAIGVGAALAGACGSDDDGGGGGGPSTTTGGTVTTTNTTGAVTGTTGSRSTTGSPNTTTGAGTGGSGGGDTGGSGGGGTGGGGGGGGTGGSGGSAGDETGGTGGSGGGSAGGGGTGEAGSAGMAGMGGEGPDPLSCLGIPSRALGDDDDFTVTSSDFDFCDPMPEETTCEGKVFPESVSPEVTWTEGPEGTLSYAISFTDITILETIDPTNNNQYNRGFHYVIWDIPADTLILPAELGSGHLPSEIDDARQWAPFNDYGFMGPCPNLPTATPPLNNDSYSFTVYAMPLASLPVPEFVPGGPSFPRLMDAYFRENALAAAEYRGTSNAQASTTDGVVFPPVVDYPCPSEGTPPADCLEGP